MVSPPVMMMTTKNLPEDIQKMLDMGVSEYLMKPFTSDILFEKISFVFMYRSDFLILFLVYFFFLYIHNKTILQEKKKVC
jgi:DNA-binding response OmpR family regulator